VSPPLKAGRIDDPIWAEEPEPPTPHVTRWWQVAAVPVAFVGIPALAVWVRGICWESAVVSAVALLVVLVLVRLGVQDVVLVLALFLLLTAGLLVGWSRATAHTFDVFGPPARLRYCGRDYNQGSVVGRAALDRKAVREVAVAPSGSAVLASGCDTTGIWVQTGSTTYIGYGLQGGP
jgi:hypothetical protein